MAKGIDCATKLTASSAKSLASTGITHVGRYLSDNWKGLKKEEVAAIQNAGMQIFSIYETNPVYVGYFTSAQGKADALAAENYAKALGQPKGSVIYFTVDYDAVRAEFDAILAYFKAVTTASNYYKVGAYGSYSVLDYLHNNKIVDYYFQTYAWSRGQVADFINVHQYQNDTTLAGIAVDLDEIKKADIGAWGKTDVSTSTQKSKPATPDKTSTYTIKKGDTFWDLEEKNNWEHGTLQKLNPNANPTNLQIGQKIKIPTKSKQQAGSTPIYHTVVKGDTVSELALKYGSTINQIQSWNNLDKNYTIFINQKLRVK